MDRTQEGLLEDIDSLPAESLDRQKQLSQFLDLLAEADTRELLDRLTLGLVMSNLLTNHQLQKYLDIHVMQDFAIPPRGVEFIVGVLVCQDPNGTRTVTYQELTEQYAWVSDAYLLNETALYAGGAIDEHRYNLRRGLVHRELTTGRFHEPQQAIQAAQRCYRSFDAEMKNTVGYTIGEAIDVIGFVLLSQEQQTRMLLRRIAPSTEIPRRLKATMEEDVGEGTGVNRMVENPRLREGARFIDSLYERWEKLMEVFWIDTTTAIQHLPSGIDTKTFLSVIQSLRVQVGDPEEIPNLPFESPFDGPNPIEVRPLLELDGMLLPSTGGALARGLAETYYYRLYNHMSRGARKKEFERRWGVVLESWTEDVLTPVFGQGNILVNRRYHDGRGTRGEVDLLIEVDEALLVIECKSKKLPTETRGVDPERFEDHLQAGVGKAAQQTSRFIKTLLREGTLNLTGTDGQITLEAADYNRYQPIVVLRDWYDHIATVDYTRILDDIATTPYVIDIFALEAVADILDTPSAFDSYVSARRGELNKRRYFSMDELDYLDLYLSNDDSFPEPPTENLYQIDNRSGSIVRRLSPDFVPDMWTLFGYRRDDNLL